MTQNLFIAEKPSLAEEIAKARADQLDTKANKSRGYWEVGDDKVCWLFGHMYEQVGPEEYDERYKSWNLDDLPIIPENWKLKVSNDKADHIKGIASLLKGAETVVNCGDPAREGQLLVDEVLVENDWNPFNDNTKRLWVQSMARSAMLAALEGMSSNKEKENLYWAAVCRQRADWLHGMNLSRLYTIKARQAGADQTVSVGRVQTPTLKLVVDRDLEIKNFKPVDHYLPTGVFIHENGKFTASYVIPDDSPGLDSEGRMIDKAVADEINERIAGKTGTITAYSASDKSKAPPLPHSLSALQTECSSKFGLSAQQTLDVAQKLYETHKLTTYPRSDSRYLPTAILKDEAPEILKNLVGTDNGVGDAAEGSDAQLKSAAWNDSKVSDHHGIIPTMDAKAESIAKLSGVERKVFDLIAKTFLAQFYPAQRWKALSATVKVDKDTFKASGRKEVDSGWRRVFTGEQATTEDEEDEDVGQTLPEMKKDDAVSVESGEVQSKRTTPPPHFTDGTLIAAMSNIHKFVPDSESKKRLKENEGLGTEATRANMIETLIKRSFMQRKGKNKIVSTVTGQSVISALPPEITDPALTAIWEGYLAKVEKGDLDHEKFMEVQAKDITTRVENGKSADVKITGAKKITPLDGHGDACPKCSAGKMVTREIRKGKHKGKKFLSCDQYPNCDAVKWPEIKVDPIDGHGKECPKCDKGKMVTRQIQKGDHKGKKFLSCDQYPECKSVEWPKPKPIEGHGKQCPKCTNGVMETRKSKKGTFFLGCNKYPDCDAVEFQKDNVKKLPGDGETCDKCGKGTMTTRKIHKGDKKGQTFLSCDKYPECKNAKWPDKKTKS